MKWWIKLRKDKDASCALPLLYINTNKPYAAKSLNEAAPPHPFTPNSAPSTPITLYISKPFKAKAK